MGGSSKNRIVHTAWAFCLLAALCGSCSCPADTSTEAVVTEQPRASEADRGIDSVSLAKADALYDTATMRMRRDADTLATIGMYLEAAGVYSSAVPPLWNKVLNCYGGIAAQTHRSEYSDTAFYYARAGDQLMRDHPDAFQDFLGPVPFRYFALAFSDAHKYDLARQYGTLSLDHANRTGNADRIGRSMDVLADVYSRSGDYEESISLERQNLAFLAGLLDTARTTRNNILSRMADAHLTAGESFKELGEVDSAFAHNRMALRCAELYAPGGRDAANFALNIGIAHLLLRGDADSAIHYLERAERTMPAGDAAGRSALTQGFSWLAIAYAVKGEMGEARDLTERELGKELNYFSEHPSIDWNRTDVHLMQLMDGYACVYEELFKITHDPSDARLACRLSDDIIIGHQKTFADADPGALIKASSDRTMHMNRYITFLHSCKGSDVASEKLIALFETKRSDQLRAQLQGVEELGLGGQQVRAFRELTAHRGLLVAEGHSERIVANIARLDQSIDSVRNLLSSFSSSSPNVDGAALLAQVRRSIDDSTLVLNYSWADDANGAFLQILALSRQGHWFKVMPLRPVIDSLLEAKVNALRAGTPDGDDGSLLRALVPAEVDLAHCNKLVFLPDGPLNALPFESLVVRGTGPVREYLLDGHDVRYEYCLSFLKEKAPAELDGELLACAPSFTAADTAWGGLKDRGTLKQAARSYLRSGPGPLAENIPEAERVAELFSGRVLKGHEVTEEALREELPGSGVLHFATHAVCSARLPELSGILLSPMPSTGVRGVADSIALESNDGVLHAYEIQSMDLPVELVVLSACETAVGKERMGEGAMSIARAFKYAGAKNLVSSLWKVDDHATKEIMVKFYEKLAEGMGKADALAEAKRWYRREHPDAPPSKWAAFILIGDNEPVRMKKRSQTWPWFLVGAVGVIALVAGVRWKRMRRSAA